MNLAILKSIPYVGFALYAFVKTRELSSGKSGKKAPLRANANEVLTGTISKSLKDEGRSLVFVNAGNENFWLVSDEELPGKGNRIQFSLGKHYEAYESKELEMAFESVYRIRNVELLGSVCP